MYFMYVAISCMCVFLDVQLDAQFELLANLLNDCYFFHYFDKCNLLDGESRNRKVERERERRREENEKES